MKRIISLLLAFTTLFTCSAFTAEAANNGGIKSVALEKTSYIYDGKTKKPTVIVKNSRNIFLKESGKSFVVKYPKGRKAVGTYTVSIVFNGRYKKRGTVKKTFKIMPRATAITGLNAGVDCVTVKWKKLVAQNSGYQLMYSSDKAFRSAKTVTVNSNSRITRKVSGLKSKKTYYFKIRAYKRTKTKRYYSSWSKAKKVTTKSQKPADTVTPKKPEEKPAVVPEPAPETPQAEPQPTYDKIESADYYYSSFEKAVADVNSNTSDNADSTAEEAAAGVCICENGTERIVLFNDSVNTPGVALTADTEVYLNGYTLNFGEGNYLSFCENLSLVYGSIISTNARFVIRQNGSGNALSLNGVSIESTINDSSITHRTIDASADNLTLDNSSINIEATDCASATGIYASDKSKNISVLKSDIIIKENKANGSDFSAAINAYNSENTLIEKAKINVSVDNSPKQIYGMRLANAKEIVINGGSFFCENVNADLGNAIIVPEGTGNLTINSTEKNPFTVFGKKRGLSTTAKHNTVNGGEFYSYDMAGYFVLDSEIYNATFALKNSERYTTVKGTDTLCFGGPPAATKNAVMNLYNCTIAKPEHLSNGGYAYSEQSVYIVSDYGYYSPKAVNFQNCAFYQGNHHMFWFSIPGENNPCSTQVNITGDKTKFYKKDLTQYTKNEVNNSVNPGGVQNGWKLDTKSNTNAVGNSFIGANTPESPSSSNTLYLTDKAGVYID